MICRLDNGRAKFLTRNHNNWTNRLTALAEEAEKLAAHDAILDGEVVALRPDGTTDFQELQNAFRDRKAGHLYYFVFDLLHLDGRDVTGLPLEQRKQLLADLMAKYSGSKIRFSEHLEGSPEKFLKQGCKMRWKESFANGRTGPTAQEEGSIGSR